MSNFVIDLNGDRAVGKCEFNEFMLRGEAIYNNLHGWYDDDYVRVDDRWRLRLVLKRQRSAFAPKSRAR